jgi:hypothetical protein
MDTSETMAPCRARTYQEGDPEPPRDAIDHHLWRQAQIFPLYAEQGCWRAERGCFATMLFQDPQRTRWVAVTERALEEGEVWEGNYFQRYRITWAGAKQGPPFNISQAERERRLAALNVGFRSVA